MMQLPALHLVIYIKGAEVPPQCSQSGATSAPTRRSIYLESVVILPQRVGTNAN